MKVETLIAHMNGYGPAFEKAVGDQYEIPDEHAGPLIDAGLAVAVEAAPAPALGKNAGRGQKG